MDDAPATRRARPVTAGRLSRDEADALLPQGDALLAAGRVPAKRPLPITAGSSASTTPPSRRRRSLGLGEARFRLGEDDAALASWKAVLQVGETPSA